MATAEPTLDRPLLDLADPKFLADPYPFYRLLREHAPIWRSPTGLWVLSRHADIAAVLKDPRFGHDFEGKLSDPRGRNELLDEPVFRGLGLSMLVRDPPDHTRLRSLVAKAFTARRLEEMRPKIEALVEKLLDAVEPRGRMDVIADFARPLPVLVICDLLGIPEADRPRFLTGYRVSGRWAFCSGITHADVLFAGCVLEDRPAVVALPTEQLQILDTWHTLGLRGTGSHDTVAEEVNLRFVRTPERPPPR